MKFMKPGKTNKEDRSNFIQYWAEYIKTHSDEEWSKQQNTLINSQFHSARQLSPRAYLKMKREKCLR